jgi:hypothetical protein
LVLDVLGVPLNAVGLPLSLVLDVLGVPLNAVGLPFSLALDELGLPLVPGSQARKGAGPVLLAYPAQRRKHDGADGHPLIEAAASQHMTQQSQPNQSQRQPSPKT